MFQNVDKCGCGVYYPTVTIMIEIIHRDPTCLCILHDTGLPDAFLSLVGYELLPSLKGLTCIPNRLRAFCLNAKGLEAVRESSSLWFLVGIFTRKKYVLAMNEGFVPLVMWRNFYVTCLHGEALVLILSLKSSIRLHPLMIKMVQEFMENLMRAMVSF
ncbi:hypothetical protein KIW84_031155 [Lathyrus oleraceus]|uniref:DUF913 domain-containing protein n=1 Tax=Pisum sativum TaxID=3888 RepID=A0A9D5AZY3_PEA|nr:hypothetical protein KIW84_031155 [Pisum sativum]